MSDIRSYVVATHFQENASPQHNEHHWCQTRGGIWMWWSYRVHMGIFAEYKKKLLNLWYCIGHTFIQLFWIISYVPRCQISCRLQQSGLQAWELLDMLTTFYYTHISGTVYAFSLYWRPFTTCTISTMQLLGTWSRVSYQHRQHN
jgi:hypothetical protein